MGGRAAGRVPLGKRVKAVKQDALDGEGEWRVNREVGPNLVPDFRFAPWLSEETRVDYVERIIRVEGSKVSGVLT